MQRMSCQLAVTLTAITSSQAFGSTCGAGRTGRDRRHCRPGCRAFHSAEQAPPQFVRCLLVLQVERHQRCAAARGPDRVVEFLEPAYRTGDRDTCAPALREREATERRCRARRR